MAVLFPPLHSFPPHLSLFSPHCSATHSWPKLLWWKNRENGVRFGKKVANLCPSFFAAAMAMGIQRARYMDGRSKGAWVARDQNPSEINFLFPCVWFSERRNEEILPPNHHPQARLYRERKGEERGIFENTSPLSL